MAIDKVKALKIEEAIDGTEVNPFPVESDPSEDYLSSKGLSFENTDDYIAEKLARLIGFTTPDGSEKYTYNINELISTVEFYITSSQITANRKAKVDITYNVSQMPTTEVWSLYDINGTTILRTITYTFTYTGDNITNVTEVTT
jgi:hypothetical protein